MKPCRGQLRQRDVSGEPGVVGELAAVQFVQLAELPSAAAAFLARTRLLGDLGDVGRLEVHLRCGKRSMRRASSTLAVVEAADKFTRASPAR